MFCSQAHYISWRSTCRAVANRPVSFFLAVTGVVARVKSVRWAVFPKLCECRVCKLKRVCGIELAIPNKCCGPQCRGNHDLKFKVRELELRRKWLRGISRDHFYLAVLLGEFPCRIFYV
ncbi:hypothetical protein MRX96_056868 [Rhipicephalus microplus]